MSVKGRVAIVTGAGMGLGREYAIALAAAGVKVVVNDYVGTLDGAPGTSKRAQAVVEEIHKAGGTATADSHDVSRYAKAIIAAAVRAYNTVDTAFMRVLEIGVLGTTFMTSAAYATMQNQGYGRIINVSSNAVYGFGAGGNCAYAASKGAIYALARDLGRYAYRDNIKINGILPGLAMRGNSSCFITWEPAPLNPEEIA